jgi:hypothetical protein
MCRARENASPYHIQRFLEFGAEPEFLVSIVRDEGIKIILLRVES